MKISSMNYLFRQGIRNIWTNRIMSVATFCILLVSLLLIGFTRLFNVNIDYIVGGIEDKNEVIIFLEDGISEDAIEQMGSKLKNMDNISEVRFYSKDEAFKDIKSKIDDAEELFSFVGEESPLPDSYRVRIKDISEMSRTLMDIGRINGIEKLKAPNDFVNLLKELRSVISVMSSGLLVALIIVSLVIISNAERASVDMRKREIAIMKYVGAKNSFIKIPFFVEGMTLGMLAGAAAAAITIVGYNKIDELLSTNATTLSVIGLAGLKSIAELTPRIILIYIVTGAFISAAGTVMSTKKYLKV